jgi:hypothetical protein
LKFQSEREELDFLRHAVGHLIGGQGRLTAGESMSLDLGWDLLEEYYEENLRRHSDEKL